MALGAYLGMGGDSRDSLGVKFSPVGEILLEGEVFGESNTSLISPVSSIRISDPMVAGGEGLVDSVGGLICWEVLHGRDGNYVERSSVSHLIGGEGVLCVVQDYDVITCFLANFCGSVSFRDPPWMVENGMWLSVCDFVFKEVNIVESFGGMSRKNEGGGRGVCNSDSGHCCCFLGFSGVGTSVYLQLVCNLLAFPISVVVDCGFCMNKPFDPGGPKIAVQDLFVVGFLSPTAIALCVVSAPGLEVLDLKEFGVDDVVGIFKLKSPILVIVGDFFACRLESIRSSLFLSGMCLIGSAGRRILRGKWRGCHLFTVF